MNLFFLFLYLKVILNSPVCRLHQVAHHVVVTCENGKSYKARYVISAMPQVLLNSVSFDPPLPPLKGQLIQRIPMGSVIKSVTFYERAFWRAKGLSGLLISDSGPAYIAVDDTKPDESYPALMRLVFNTTSGDVVTYSLVRTRGPGARAVWVRALRGCVHGKDTLHSDVLLLLLFL